MPRDRFEVRRFVEASFRPAMDAADPARRQHLNTRGRSDLNRCRDRGAAKRTRRQDGRDVADRDLRDAGLVREAIQKDVARTDDGDAVVERDRRRHHAECADLRLEGSRRDQVSRAREAVGDDRGFKRDDRSVRSERLRDLGRDRELHRRPEA